MWNLNIYVFCPHILNFAIILNVFYSTESRSERTRSKCARTLFNSFITTQANACAHSVGVLFGFCKILENVKLHIVKTTITIISHTPNTQTHTHTYTHARSRTHTHTHRHVHTHPHTHSYTRTHTHTHSLRSHACTLARPLTHSHTHTHTHSLSFSHTHTQTHTRTHTHTHTHTQGNYFILLVCNSSQSDLSLLGWESAVCERSVSDSDVLMLTGVCVCRDGCQAVCRSVWDQTSSLPASD